ncbi:MAG: M28 family peptidase [Spirochaetales bacterium]|nr:M28 family peptidase [Spirochaetales bacterium]
MSFDSGNAYGILKSLAERGKRPPGTEEHREAILFLHESLSRITSKSWLHEFTVPFRGNNMYCANICGFIEGKNTGYTLLIGSHFDTRWIADNETDPLLVNHPIPGVNDGTSGVAVILELARIYHETVPACNLLFILFDAEDIGNIDGCEFSVGADHYARKGLIKPDFVIALDMVGGKDMHLNLDLNSLATGPSVQMVNRVFSIGRSLKYPAFFENATTAIIGDHYPFLRQGIPAAMLIDINYPQWHTQNDVIEYCSEFSLKQVGDVLYSLLEGVWFSEFSRRYSAKGNP